MKALVIVALSILAGCARQEPLPVYGQIPGFELVAETGQPFNRQALDGKVWVADFIFTNCGGTCPLMTDKMRKLQDALPAEVHLVSFTVDPTRDTPKVLAAYAEEHGASRDRWLFLTGEKQAMYDICVTGFKLPLDTEGGTPAEPIAHSTRFVLVDKHGDIRGYYSGTEEDELRRLSADAKKLS